MYYADEMIIQPGSPLPTHSRSLVLGDLSWSADAERNDGTLPVQRRRDTGYTLSLEQKCHQKAMGVGQLMKAIESINSARIW